MINDIDYTDEIYDLVHQIDINSLQLRDLTLRMRTDQLNLAILCIVWLFCVGIFVVLFASFLFPNLSFSINRNLLEYSISISVFLLLAISKITQLIHHVWIRMDEAKLLVYQQEDSIRYAKKVLDTWHEVQ